MRLTVALFFIFFLSSSFAQISGGLPPINQHSISKLSTKKVVPFKSFDYFLPYKNNAPKEYISQFFLKEKSTCEALAAAQDPDGLFCLYVLSKQAGEVDVAFSYLFKSAELGNPLGQSELGWALRDGYGAQADSTAYVAWKIKAAESNVVGAQLEIGWLYMSTPSPVQTNYDAAMKWNMKAYENGSGEAAANIGLLYERGWGVKIDNEIAADWYKKAIAGGGAYSGQAQARLGWLYKNGLGVNQDIGKARDLFQQVLTSLPRAEAEWKQDAEKSLRTLP